MSNPWKNKRGILDALEAGYLSANLVSVYAQVGGHKRIDEKARDFCGKIKDLREQLLEHTTAEELER